MVLFIININVKAQETTSIYFSVRLVDSENNQGKRPEEVTIDLMKGDTVVDTKTIIPDDDGSWDGSFDYVDKYDSNNNRILYTVREHGVSNYNIVVKQGELIDEYEYPTNTSDVELSTSTTTTPTIDVPGNNGWKIQPGLKEM